MVQRLACYYGLTTTEAENECSIDPESPPYFGKYGNDSYGIKENSAIALIDSEGYGQSIAHKWALWKIKHQSDEHDTESCIRHMQEIPDEFHELVDATQNLRRYGY